MWRGTRTSKLVFFQFYYNSSSQMLRNFTVRLRQVTTASAQSSTFIAMHLVCGTAFTAWPTFAGIYIYMIYFINKASVLVLALLTWHYLFNTSTL